MKITGQTYIAIRIDKLTNSIENVKTGDSLATEISMLEKTDLNSVVKKMAGFSIGKTNFPNPTAMFIS